ncbi:phosphate signaling complex protein PhoU [Pelagicoccus sp. SDUM812002]|uniref:phosphate signaling complex protein PhoU n=1 Tax=Pelagicoccus sp. SDUM812002 TaxID=3041266 RepID=UPI00280D1CEF|nr:phosphate signaling complex protein PhoU [Pelagicoccus sp. SDUM812002]MDQ8187845.1 phosphate signaling complex protein PhoU [Pelagicoccus sp. SDUM812002]
MKRYFHEELEDVRSHLMLMGEKAIANVNLAMRALLDSDLATAQQVRAADDRIDEIEKQIDDEVARYIGLRAPVARDLRLLFVAIKASHDLERVGDEATSIAKRTAKILKTGSSTDDLGRLPRMCELAVGMLKDALHCFIDEDSTRAIAISERDEEVDSLNRENFRYFLDMMKKDPKRVDFGTEMVFISKSMERIADHAQNIAEEVYYLLTTHSLKEVIADRKSV